MIMPGKNSFLWRMSMCVSSKIQYPNKLEYSIFCCTYSWHVLDWRNSNVEHKPSKLILEIFTSNPTFKLFYTDWRIFGKCLSPCCIAGTSIRNESRQCLLQIVSSCQKKNYGNLSHHVIYRKFFVGSRHWSFQGQQLNVFLDTISTAMKRSSKCFLRLTSLRHWNNERVKIKQRHEKRKT